MIARKENDVDQGMLLFLRIVHSQSIEISNKSTPSYLLQCITFQFCKYFIQS